jgi:hypothetical protein
MIFSSDQDFLAGALLSKRNSIVNALEERNCINIAYFDITSAEGETLPLP